MLLYMKGRFHLYYRGLVIIGYISIRQVLLVSNLPFGGKIVERLISSEFQRALKKMRYWPISVWFQARL